MDIDQLRTFLVVAREKNFTLAANELYISQSTVSKRIKILEKELGCDLFIRADKYIKLSSDGERFLPYVHNALECLNNGIEVIKEYSLDGEMSLRTIRIAATSGLNMIYVPKLLLHYREENPNREIDLYTKRSNIILDMLNQEEIDLGILSFNRMKEAPQYNHLKSILLLQDDYTLVIHRKLLKQDQPLELKHLLQIPLIRYQTGAYWTPIDELFEKLNVPPLYSSVQSDSTQMIIQLVKDGVGYSFLPNYLVKHQNKDDLYMTTKIEHIQLPSRTVDIVFLKKNMKLAKTFLKSP